jgi:hypothetical protein
MIDLNHSPTDFNESVRKSKLMQDENTDVIKLLSTEIESNSRQDKAKDNHFPMSGMPQVLADLINDSVAVYASPIEYFACTLLVACCSVVRKRAVLDDGKYKNYPQLWIMYVGSSGIGKDAPLKIAFKPIIDLDLIAYRKYELEMNEWKIIEATCKKNKEVSAPKPYPQMILIDDATPESLYPALQQNGGLTLHRDELSGWFKDFGRYSKSGEVARYLSLYSNGSFNINRVGKDFISISDPYYSIIGGIQPLVLSSTLNENQMRENGLAQRFLFAYPDNAKQPMYNEAIPNPVFALRYKKLIEYLHDNDFGKLTLSLEAKLVYIDFVNEMVHERNKIDIEYHQALYSRFRMHVLRIALILELIKSYPIGLNDVKSVSLETMKYAIDICRYFIICGLKVEKLGSSNNRNKQNDMKDVAKLLLEKNITQTETARITGLSQSTISRIK